MNRDSNKHNAPLEPHILAEDAKDSETDTVQVGDTMAQILERINHLNEMGQASLQSNTGSRREELEHALDCFLQARALCENEAPTLAASATNMATLHFAHPWAVVQNNLGNAYLYRLEGIRAENLQSALACYQAALAVFDQGSFPYECATAQHNVGLAHLGLVEHEQDASERAIAAFQQAARTFETLGARSEWATAQNSLGAAYLARALGTREENIDCAIAFHQAAVAAFSALDQPFDWAMTQLSLGNAFQEQRIGGTRIYLENAIACYTAALSAFSAQGALRQQILVQISLGAAYVDRIAGDPFHNLQQAMTCFAEVERLSSRVSDRATWAGARNNTGNAFARLATLEPENAQAHLERAVQCFKEALEIYSAEVYPREHRLMLWNLGNAEARRGQWQGAHEAYARAHAVEGTLYNQGLGIEGRDAVRTENWDAHIRDAFCLVQLGWIPEAIATLEASRAQEMARAWELSELGERSITPSGEASGEAPGERYSAALHALSAAEAAHIDSALMRSANARGENSHSQTLDSFAPRDLRVILQLQDAQREVEAARAILVDAATSHSVSTAAVLAAASQAGPRHAVVYIVASPWGGAAVAAISADPTSGDVERSVSLLLPELTYDAVTDLIEARCNDGSNRPLGGFAYAQEGIALRILWQHWSAPTLGAQARLIREVADGEQRVSALHDAVALALNVPELRHMADSALDALTDQDLRTLSNTVNVAFLELELARVRAELQARLLQPLEEWLTRAHVSGVSLVPCGWLAAFPLSALAIGDEYDGHTLADVVPTTLAPAARVLMNLAITSAGEDETGGVSTSITTQHAKRSNRQNGNVTRRGVFAIGNPYPTHQDLPWGEAEAQAIVSIGQALRIPTGARIQEDATRAWLLDKLAHAQVVVASCHGSYLAHAPLQSGLRLARNEPLTLADILTGVVDLQGLRLLVLSACQTAIAHLRGPTDEVRGITTGMLQAGVQAVIATLWPVDDEATYLLITRFALEWFPRMKQEPPAAALARAQQWLRTVSNSALQQWRSELSNPTPGSPATPTMFHEHAAPIRGDTPMIERPGVSGNLEDVSTRRMESRTPMRIVRGAGARYDVWRYDYAQADEEIRNHAWERGVQDERVKNMRPFASPIYWAAFQVYGW